MSTALDLKQLVQHANSLPEFSIERLAVLEEAVRLADILGDPLERRGLRLEFIREAVFTGQVLKALPAFAWLLGEAKETKKGDRFTTKDILTEYKWILGNIVDFYEIPLTQIKEAFEDFKKELKANGYTEYIYWYMRR